MPKNGNIRTGHENVNPCIECKLVCSVLWRVDLGRIYSSTAQNLKFYWSITIMWKRKAAGKSGLFEKAQIFPGTTTPKLANTSAVIFSHSFEPGVSFS